jgi:hypothetical protein
MPDFTECEITADRTLTLLGDNEANRRTGYSSNTKQM